MKRNVAIAIIAGLLCFFTAGSGADDTPKKVMSYLAVMDLRCHKGIDKDQCAALTEVLIDELVKNKKYTVIDRANRDKILGEAGFQMTGCVDEGCTIDAGKILGVGKIVIGSVTQLGDLYLVNIQLINVETAAVETSTKEKCKGCGIGDLVDTVTNAARKLMGQSAIPVSDTAPVPTKSSDDQIPKPEEIKFIPATPEQQKLCPEGMVYIPAGWFMMGCNTAKDSQCKPDEHPYHKVYLNAFCIDKYKYPNTYGKKPESSVNWTEIKKLCGSKEKRLPTEAEWEKAARGTDGRVYPWGETIDPSKAKYGGWTVKGYSGAYSPNRSPYGVYDMAGNLFEWVEDWYDDNYYQSSPSHNPKGPSSGEKRVARGGCWACYSPDLRSSSRSSQKPNKRYYLTGGRCAKDAK